MALGYGTHQVLFNTDLYGKTSGTYKASVSSVDRFPHRTADVHNVFDRIPGIGTWCALELPSTPWRRVYVGRDE